jgi:cytochrome c biogenesis protein CcdA
VTGTFLLYAMTLLPFAAFVPYYWVTVPRWWRNRISVMLMMLGVSMVSVLVFVLIALAFPGLPQDVRDYLRVVTLGGVSVAGWLLLANLHIEHRQALRTDSPNRRSTDPKES